MKRRRRAVYMRRRVEAMLLIPGGLDLVHVRVPVQLVVVVDVALDVAPKDHIPVRPDEKRVWRIRGDELLGVLASLNAAILVERQGPLLDQGVYRGIRVAHIVRQTVPAGVPPHVVPAAIPPP